MEDFIYNEKIKSRIPGYSFHNQGPKLNVKPSHGRKSDIQKTNVRKFEIQNVSNSGSMSKSSAKVEDETKNFPQSISNTKDFAEVKAIKTQSKGNDQPRTSINRNGNELHSLLYKTISVKRKDSPVAENNFQNGKINGSRKMSSVANEKNSKISQENSITPKEMGSNASVKDANLDEIQYSTEEPSQSVSSNLPNESEKTDGDTRTNNDIQDEIKTKSINGSVPISRTFSLTKIETIPSLRSYMVPSDGVQVPVGGSYTSMAQIERQSRPSFKSSTKEVNIENSKKEIPEQTESVSKENETDSKENNKQESIGNVKNNGDVIKTESNGFAPSSSRDRKQNSKINNYNSATSLNGLSKGNYRNHLDKNMSLSNVAENDEKNYDRKPYMSNDEEFRKLLCEMAQPVACKSDSTNLERTLAIEPLSSQRKALYMDEMRKQMNLSEQLLKAFTEYIRFVRYLREAMAELHGVLHEYYVCNWPDADEWRTILDDMISIWKIYENDLNETLNVVLSHLELFESIETVLNKWLDAKDGLRENPPSPPTEGEKNRNKRKESLLRMASDSTHYEVNPSVKEKLHAFNKLDEELEQNFQTVVASRVQFIDECFGRHFKSLVILFQGLTQTSCIAHDIATSLPCRNPCIPIGCLACPPLVKFWDVCTCKENYEYRLESEKFEKDENQDYDCHEDSKGENGTRENGLPTNVGWKENGSCLNESLISNAHENDSTLATIDSNSLSRDKFMSSENEPEEKVANLPETNPIDSICDENICKPNICKPKICRENISKPIDVCKENTSNFSSVSKHDVQCLTSRVCFYTFVNP